MWHLSLSIGTSPLGEMPLASEVATLGLAAAGTPGEDPLSSSILATESKPTGHGTPSPSVDAPILGLEGGRSAAPGFLLGHGFPLIPAKLIAKIQRWEYVNLSELLPNNLELARCTLCEPRGSLQRRLPRRGNSSRTGRA